MTYLLCKFIKNNWQRRCRAAKLYSAKVFAANLPVTAISGSSFVGSVPKLLYLCGFICFLCLSLWSWYIESWWVWFLSLSIVE